MGCDRKSSRLPTPAKQSNRFVLHCGAPAVFKGDVPGVGEERAKSLFRKLEYGIWGREEVPRCPLGARPRPGVAR